MKRIIALLTLCVLLLTCFTGCGNAKTGDAETDAFVPTKTIQWWLSSSPGGGSDIITRTISGIMTDEQLVNGQAFALNYKTDGQGEIVRNEIAGQKNDPDYQMLTFNSGDIIIMADISQTRSADFNILAIMAVEHSLLLKAANSSYENFADAVEAAKNGTKVIVGSSGGDQYNIYKSMLAKVGVDEEMMPYVVYDSVSEGIVACLGGHVDFTLSGPASASEYVKSGDLVPVLALNNERFDGIYADVPILSELGDYEDVTTSQWRGIVGPKAMSDAAVAYWSEMFGKVSQTDAWLVDYIEKNQMTAYYLNHEEATQFVADYEKECLANSGKSA